MRRSSVLAVALFAVVALIVPAPGSQAATLPLPTSMAATGDSISRGFDATPWGCFLADCPQYSWSTASSSSVLSHYRRLTAAGAKVTAYNDAQTGAKMAALAGQLQTAAGQQAQYVTVLMGANDVCTSGVGTMTDTATFTSQFSTALSGFFTANPNAHLFVSSIPNVYQLWSLLHTNSGARGTWSTFGICQSMLASTNTDAQRQAVQAQEAADNAALATVCATFANCRWDQYATFNYTFTTGDVSTVDYFHPSIGGQNHLAGVTWPKGWYV